MSSQPSPVEVGVLIDGCLAAIERLLTATKDSAAGANETFVPLFEALNWAASIDLRYEELGTPIGNEPLRGMRFARNRVHHQWELALTRQDWPGAPVIVGGRDRYGRGGVSRTSGPPPGFYWTWKSLADLPAPDRPDPTGEAFYGKHLADGQAEPTLQALKPVLETLR
jgi:hypothetical protein